MSESSYQLPLSISRTFTYRPEQFIEHSGVQKIINQLELLTTGSFRAISVVGQPRSGKTHLSFFILEALGRLGFAASLRIAPDLRRLENLEYGRPAICIDDAHNVFSNHELVSAFVSLYEQVRQASGVIILLSNRALESENPHLQSRFAALTPFQIEAPAREEIPALLQAIAKQRGLKLRERDRAFLERRLGADIASLELYVERLLEVASFKDGRIGLETLKDAI